MKRKLNLTIDSLIISKAKQYAEENNISLSSIIEESLKKITISPNKSIIDFENAFNKFYKKFLPKDFKVPSNEQIRNWRSEIGNKYK